MKTSEEKIISFLENKFPKSNALSWDFVGYSLKSKPNKYSNLKVLICLDVNQKAIEQAIENQVNLIISFHPFKFGKTWKEIYEKDIFKQHQVNQLKKNKISVYSLHTNYEKNKPNINIQKVAQRIPQFKLFQNYDFMSIVSFKGSMKNLVDIFKKTFEFNNIQMQNLIMKSKILFSCLVLVMFMNF